MSGFAGVVAIRLSSLCSDYHSRTTVVEITVESEEPEDTETPTTE